MNAFSLVTLFCFFTASSGSGSGEADESYAQGAACYGIGGGHGSWTCGSSKAWCTASGGSWYAADYRSSRSPFACMCSSGCTATSAVSPGFTKGDGHDGKGCYDTTSHTVACGMSAADCGGVAYAPGDLNTHGSGKGCCLCDENCDHTIETGTNCTSKYYDAVSSPTPPPQPPPPPPSPMFPPIVGDSGDFVTVTFSMKASGDVSDYGTSKQALIAAKCAVIFGVHSSDITVTVTAGSAIITIAVKVPDAAAATKVTTAITANFATAADALAAMGGNYGSIFYRKSVLSVEPATTVETASKKDLPTGALIGIIVGGVVVLAIVGFFVYSKCIKTKSAGKGKTPV